jgi:hypothetical protein
MLPNLSIHEHLMVERHQELQREMAEPRLIAGLPWHHLGVVRRLATGVGTLFLALRTRLTGLGSGGEQGVYEQSSVQETKMNRTTVA